MRGRAFAYFLFPLAVFATVDAQAQSTDKVLAEALFREGRELMAQDKISEACGKFAESQRLDPALGTLVNLALCHEKEGKTASAWAEFQDAAAEAAVEKDDREAFARKHIAALDPELARLRLVVAPTAGALTSLELRLDGHPIGRAAWTSPLPIDPGEHEISGKAQGKKPYVHTFTVAKGPGITELAFPALDDEPKPIEVAPAPAAADAPAGSAGKTQRLVGYVLAGVGVAGVAFGGVLGVSALSLKSDRDALCTGDNLCDSTGVAKDKHARDAATASTIGFLAGGALLAGGVVLVLTAPKAPVQVGVAGSRLVVGGSF